MIRNAFFGISLLALSATSAFAAPVKHHTSTTRVVAQAGTPGADSTAPAGDKATKKHTKKAKAAKSEKTDAPKEMNPSAPASEKSPAAAPATK